MVDASSGQPLSGVVVNDLSTDDRSAASATTNANGFFTLTSLYDGVQNLTLTGYLLSAPVSATVTTTADALGVDVLATQAGQITGHVTAASNGGRLANIEVQCTGQTTGQGFEVLTAADGSYSFGTLPADTYTVSISAKGYVSTSLGDIALALGQTSANQNFSLVAGATITGTVSSQTGPPSLAAPRSSCKAKPPVSPRLPRRPPTVHLAWPICLPTHIQSLVRCRATSARALQVCR